MLLVEYEEIEKWIPKYDSLKSKKAFHFFVKENELENARYCLVLKFDSEGRLTHRIFWRNQQKHRPIEEGPAYESWHKGECHYWEYWQFGIEYNVDGTLSPDIIDPIV